MSEVPLSQLIRYRKGRPPAKDTGEADIVPVLTPEYMRNGVPSQFTPRTVEQCLMTGEELILLWDGSNAGEFFRSRFGMLGSTMVALDFNTNELDCDYLYYELKRFEPELKAKTAGSGIPHVDKEILLSHTIRKPERSQQSKIAHVLATLDRAITQTDALLAKQQRVKAGLMQELLTRGIDEDGNRRDPRTHAFKDSPLGPIPVEWEAHSVKDLFRMELGKMLSKEAKKERNPKPYLGNSNVQWGRIAAANLETMDFSPAEMKRLRLRRNDILICEGGEVGRTALWKDELPECYFQKAIHRLTSLDERIQPQYMQTWMQFRISQGALTDLVSQTSIAHLTQEKLALVMVAYPTPKEMGLILQVLDDQDTVLTSTQRSLRKMQALKAGLMQDLLTGRVSVLPLLHESKPV